MHKQIKTNINFDNRYRITLKDAKTGEIKQQFECKNTWTNYLADTLMSYTGAQQFRYAGVGYLQDPPTKSLNSLPLVGAYPHKALWESSASLHTFSDKDYVSVTFTLTYSETEAIGTINSLGLGYSVSGNTGDHRLNGLFFVCQFLDAEDQPLEIQKSYTDVLTVDVELRGYFNPSLPSNIKVFHRLESARNLTFFNSRSYYNDFDFHVDRSSSYLYYDSPSSYYPVINSAVFGAVYNSLTVHYQSGKNYVMMLPGNVSNDLVLSSPRPNLVSSNNVLSLTTAASVLSGKGNLDGTYLIKSIVFHDGRFVYLLNLPDADVYPATELEFTLTGNGTDTDFNIPVPELMADTPTITIDGVPVSNFVWNARNYEMIQGWECHNSDYVKHLSFVSDYSRGSFRLGVPDLAVCASILDAPYWDFGGPFEVSVYEYGDPSSNLSVTASTLQGTNDLEGTWTDIATINSSNRSVSINPPVNYRYYRVNGVPSSSTTTTVYKKVAAQLGFFGSPKPMLSFPTPPAAGSAIKVKAKTAYPLKNANWIISGFSVDIQYTVSDPE